VPQVIYTEPGDEIVDLVDRVRKSPDADVALVLGAGTLGMRTPLNVRLLRQLGTQAGKRVSVISGDPYIQGLSRVGGLPTYASVPAFERGIQTVRPHSDEGPPLAGGAAAFAGAGVAGGAAGPLGAPAPPPPPPRAGGAGSAAGRAGSRLAGRRRPLYFIAAGLVVLAILLFLVVAPSAKVTITLTGTPLSANPTIQGSADPGTAGQPDHIVTSVVTSDQSAQFTATPTGKQPVPAAAATATAQFSDNVAPGGVEFGLAKGAKLQTTDPSITFIVTQATDICMGYNGAPPTACVAGTPNSTAPVADQTPEAKGNVAVGAINAFSDNPCPPGNSTPQCHDGSISVTNLARATGGADAKTNIVASQTDVSGWTTQVTQSEQTLTTQANQDMQTKAAGKVLAKDPGGNGVTVACTVTPALPVANAVFATAQITVACHGKAATYNPGDISNDVKADLQKQVAQGDTLATDAINCTKPSVTQAADDGTVVLSVQCTSFSRPSIDLAALKGQLTGHSPGDARNIIEHRLNRVQSVVVKQSPIPFFWLPFFASRIEIDEAFVTQAGP
jgi:hypothetical protein